MPPSPTRSRVRLSLAQKAQLVEESTRPGFNRKEACKRFGISNQCLSNILKGKEAFLDVVDLKGSKVTKKFKNVSHVLVVHFYLQVALLATLKIVYNPDLVYKRVLTDLYTKSGFDCI